jgi:hypothetical protein
MRSGSWLAQIRFRLGVEPGHVRRLWLHFSQREQMLYTLVHQKELIYLRA